VDLHPDETAIFLHVPKAGGTTLQTIIERHYRPSETFFAGTLVQDALESLRKTDTEVRERIRLATGHIPYGLHDDLPGRHSYFTVLREPIDRVVSFYYFVRQNDAHYLHDFASTVDLGLAGFMRSGASVMLDNAQTRLISGVWSQVPYGELSPDALELAKRRLRDRFDVVGLAERFDETLLILGRRYGWKHLYYRRQNVTARRPQVDALDPEQRRAVAEHNRLDQQLYQYAQELFERQVRREGPGFARRLRRFRRMNRSIGPAYSLGWRALLKARRVVGRERRIGQAHGERAARP
jgi:hypothetical protein